MERSHYLHVLVPGRGQLTLSFPGGVRRALESGRLTPDTLAWSDSENLWQTLTSHPWVATLLQPPVASLPAQADSSEILELFPDQVRSSTRSLTDAELDVLFQDAAPPVVPDPNQLPLIPLEDAHHHSEFHRFLAQSTEREQRRDAVRNSGGIRPAEALQIFVAGVRDREAAAGRASRRWWRARSMTQRVAALVALTLVTATALGLLLTSRAGDLGRVPPDIRLVDNAVGSSGSIEAARRGIHVVSATESRPLLVPENDLESDLEIADAITWQPSVDFASEEQILRATRKVDAVRNIISLYRVSSWRLMNGAHRDGDPWLEPYAESSRIDEVLQVMKSAVVLLDSVAPRLKVDRGRLVFDNPAESERYTELRHRADSLLQAPVELDSFPVIRAPRRVVTRLLSTLPPAVALFRVQ